MKRVLTVPLLMVLLVAASCSSKKETQREDEPMGNDNPTVVAAATDVSWEAAGLEVFGEITRPDGEGPFPALAIAAGSGPTDRDWNNPLLPGTNGSAKMLAEALRKRGIVVLRYDKRGTGRTGMPSQPIKWGDYVDELRGALGVLRQRSDVDGARIFVAGHSEGGVHALRAAASEDVAGVLLLSTAGRTLRDIVIWQIANQIRTSGLNEAAAQAEIDALTSAIDRITAGEVVDAKTVGQLPGVQQFLLALQNPLSVDFARELLVFDPLAAIAALQMPVLVLSGARDVQVDPVLDAKPLAEAAQAAGRRTTYVIADEADHVLKRETTPGEQLIPAQVGMRYNADGRELDPVVVDAIASFVLGE